MKHKLTELFHFVRGIQRSRRRWIVLTAFGVCLIPATATAGMGDIFSLLQTITSTIQGAIGGALSDIQKVETLLTHYRQEIIWPLAVLNQTKSSGAKSQGGDNMTTSVQATSYLSARREILARQGMRLPSITLRHLRDARIYCQPTLSIEHQHEAKRWVLRGVESGGATVDLGAYSGFIRADGSPLPWLQRVDSVGVNGVHAITVAQSMLRLEMIRIGKTYDLFITRHCLANSDANRRPKFESSIVFYGRRGILEMELWGKDCAFRGSVYPVFYTRSGEVLTVPAEFVWAAANLTTAACCVGCRHCHLLEPAGTGIEDFPHV